MHVAGVSVRARSALCSGIPLFPDLFNEYGEVRARSSTFMGHGRRGRMSAPERQYTRSSEVTRRVVASMWQLRDGHVRLDSSHPHNRIHSALASECFGGLGSSLRVGPKSLFGLVRTPGNVSIVPCKSQDSLTRMSRTRGAIGLTAERWSRQVRRRLSWQFGARTRAAAFHADSKILRD